MKNIAGLICAVAAIIVTIILVVVIFSKLFPASKNLNNDQIITETKKCEEAGMTSIQIIGGWSHDVKKVVCKPRKGE